MPLTGRVRTMSSVIERGELRSKLVSEIQDAGSSRDNMAKISAVEFARHPDDAERRERAITDVRIADAIKAMTESVIGMVNRYWPKD